MSKNKSDWRPSATIDLLKRRAAVIATIRQFFAERDVLEVETPLLAHAAATDPKLAVMQTAPSESEPRYFLQTSPEFAMKRLLAAGSGSIYQLSKAFRSDECGRLHEPEFTMLEWYRVGFDDHALMQEVSALLQRILPVPEAITYNYRECWQKFCPGDPHHDSFDELRNTAEALIPQAPKLSDRDDYIDLLWSHFVAPHLGQDAPCFITDYPASQAALARLRTLADGTQVAARFELYIRGIELANGYHELCDVEEQRARMLADQQARRIKGLPAIPLDEHLLAALQHGLPDCAGVALGLDRLLMLALGASMIAEVMAFSGVRRALTPTLSQRERE